MWDRLEAMQRRGEIELVRPQGMTLKWGHDRKTGAYMNYTPDFVYETQSGVTHLIEVKGAHIVERDLARFRGCRADWPQFDFEMWQWIKGEWGRIL